MDIKRKTLLPISLAAFEMKSDIWMLVYDEMIVKYGLKGAYEKMEDEHERVFGTRKYASYDSFRQIRNRSIKNGTMLPKKRP
jgi:hypothetical protein